MGESEVIAKLIEQGAFAVLFVWLLFYVLRRNKEREEHLEQANKERESRLHDLLEKFSEKYDVVIEELRDIKTRIGGDDK